MSRRALVVLQWVLILVLGHGVVLAEDAPLRLPLTVAEMPAPRVRWYGIYMKGGKVGYMRDEFGRAGEGPAACYFTDQTGRIEIASMQQKVVIDLSERAEFDVAPPFTVRRARSKMTQTGGGKDVEITRAADGTFSARVDAGGESRTLPVGAFDFTLADSLTSERWIQAGRAVGDTATVRSPDVSELKLRTTALTVLARKEAVVAGVRTQWYEVKSLSEKGTVSTDRIDGSGRIISSEFGGLFELRSESEEIAKKIEASSDLFVFGMAKLDKPIGPATKVRRLVMTTTGEGAAALPAGPHQEVVRDAAAGTTTIRLGQSVGEDAAATAAEIQEALAETVDSPTKLPAVKALAAQAVGDAKTPREKVARLVKFVGDYVVDALTPRAVAVPDIIATKRGDCSEHALLFTALARAAGIPARDVEGLMYMGDDAKAFGGHAWNEVVLDGKWVAVDPTWNETVLDATHITLTRNDKGMGMIATLGRLEFQLVEVEADPAK